MKKILSLLLTLVLVLGGGIPLRASAAEKENPVPKAKQAVVNIIGGLYFENGKAKFLDGAGVGTGFGVGESGQFADDTENKKFYVDQSKVIYEQDDAIPDDGVTQIMLVENDLYFLYQGGKDGVDSLIRANLKGKNQETILELDRNHSNLQYVKLSDGNEYFYYLLDENPERDSRNDEEADKLYLWRYCLQSESAERVTEEQAQWFALYDRYVYYSVPNEQEEGSALYRITFTGEDVELLDTVHQYFGGVVSDGRLYLLQDRNSKGESSMGLVACDAKGQPLEEGKGIFSIDWKNITWTSGGGWIYYNEKGSDELYRIRVDGTDKNRIQKGHQYAGLSYHNGVLYFQDGTYAEDKFFPNQGYLADDGGDWTVSCGFEAKVLVDDNGVEYVIKDGKAKVVGYVGTYMHLGLEYNYNGYPLDYNIDWDTFHTGDNVPEGFQLYLGIKSSELVYKKTADGLIITGYTGQITGDQENVFLPWGIGGTKVVEIDENAFKGCTFKRFIMYNGLKEIGKYAFDGCENLEYVLFPKTLETLGDYAFRGCPLEGQEIVLPNSLHHMGMGVFAHAKPKSVYIPASVEEVSVGFLLGCDGEYIVDPDNKKLESKDGVVFSTGGWSILAYPHDREGAYKVPKTVAVIDQYAFWDCKVNNVIFHEGMTKINRGAFQGCKKLTEVKLPKSLESLGEQAFYNTGLKTASLMWGVEGKDQAFEPSVRLLYYKD